MEFSIWTSIFALLSLLALVSCVVLFKRMRQYERRQQALVGLLRNEIQAITNSSIGMGRRVVEIEQKLNNTAEKQLELENRDPGAMAFNQAARLMEMGANVDDLVESCGIGRPEAELMALLHQELKATDSLGHQK
ncbi:DUF2802 domain-containing protein [Pontibacterium sp.]|uniref:DUF2802 domain-containing protein n=1 Tax=Pontibacterium sp. TaxID=2036026 RepID=UPI003563CF89